MKSGTIPPKSVSLYWMGFTNSIEKLLAPMQGKTFSLIRFRGGNIMRKVLSSLVLILSIFLFYSSAFAVTDTFTNPEDSYVRSTSPTANYGFDTRLLADGVAEDPDNGLFGEVVTMVQWDITSIPSSATVTGVSVTFNYSDASSGPYNIYSQDNPWAENTVDWNDLDQGPNILGTVPPFTFGLGTHALNANGVALVQGWVDGSIPNNGIMVRSGGTNNGITMNSAQSASRAPVLQVTYTNNSTQYYTVSPCAFRARNTVNTSTCGIGQGGIKYDGTGPGIIAPVNLPHGAVITEITAYFRDNDKSVRLWFRFLREGLTVGTFGTIGAGLSSGADPSYRSVSFAPVPTTSPRVDNLSSSLVILAIPINEADFSVTTWPTDNSLLVKGIVIEYEVP